VRAQIKEGRELLDIVELPLGIRHFGVEPSDGFLLNGRSLDLHGVCRHQDRKDKGWAISRDNHREDFMLIREMGATMVRLAHYQHDQYFYDLCDTHGMVVWAEIPLVNQITESAAFYGNAKQQLRELIRQNYHHPSILFWGIHNEVTSTPGPDATRLVGELADEARQEDPARFSTAASNIGQWDHQTNWESDLIAWNRYDGWYSGSIGDFALWADTIHATYPGRCIGVSEYGAGANPSHHEPAPSSVPHAGNWHPEEFQNRFHEEYWIAMKSRPFLWCKIVWNMFDFASARRNEGGQPGINDKGLVTYDRGLKKDAFFWYKANWSAEPVVHIVSSRAAHPRPQPVDVNVYSNCERVELFVDAKSHGEKTGDNMRFTWPGITVGPGTTIRAVGRRGNQEAADACSWDSACGASTPLSITR
jgi:beta-galactosidase